MHPFHQLLHQLHTNVENEADDAREKPEGNQHHLNVILNQVNIHWQLLNLLWILFAYLGTCSLLRKVLVLHPRSWAVIEEGEPNRGEQEY